MKDTSVTWFRSYLSDSFQFAHSDVLYASTVELDVDTQSNFYLIDFYRLYTDDNLVLLIYKTQQYTSGLS